MSEKLYLIATDDKIVLKVRKVDEKTLNNLLNESNLEKQRANAKEQALLNRISTLEKLVIELKHEIKELKGEEDEESI